MVKSFASVVAFRKTCCCCSS